MRLSLSVDDLLIFAHFLHFYGFLHYFYTSYFVVVLVVVSIVVVSVLVAFIVVVLGAYVYGLWFFFFFLLFFGQQILWCSSYCTLLYLLPLPISSSALSNKLFTLAK